MIQPGIDVILKVNNIVVGGQQSVNFERSMAPIDITNQIKADWEESLGGLHSWRIQCNGLYVVNSESLALLENAFMNNEEIDVSIISNGKNYFGRALITDFPLSSQYNAQFKYVLELLGVGELHNENV